MNTNNELHPVELLLIAGLALLWAITTVVRLLLVPLVGLIVALLLPRRRPAPQPAPVAPEPAPVIAATVSRQPCLADLAADLMALPAAELRAMDGTRRKASKHQLTALILAMPI